MKNHSKKPSIKAKWLFIGTIILMVALPATAKTVEYNLVISEKAVNLTGEPVQAMTINGNLHGPSTGH